MPKLIRITTSPIAFKYLLKNQPRYMQEHGMEVIMISSDGPEVADVIKNEQCPFIPVEMTRAITPFRDIRSIYNLVKIFRKEKPAIIHTHTPKAGLLGMIAAWISGVKIRLHSNSGTPLSTAKGIKRWMYFATEYLTCFAATRVLPNSRSLMDFLIAQGVCDKTKLTLVGAGSTNGINCRYYNKSAVDSGEISMMKNQVSWDPAHFYFLFAGRLLSSKGIIELIEVFEEINKQYPHTRLILAGNIEVHLDVLPAEVIAKINTHTAIHSLGWVSDIRLPMAVADVLVHPSHREGFPNVLLQAGSMKLPVICSDCIGNIDIITDGQNGLMFPVKDRSALQEAMLFAIGHKQLMANFAMNLYEFTTNSFDSETVQQNLLNFYYAELQKKAMN